VPKPRCLPMYAFRYKTRVLQESTYRHPLISITEVSETSKATTPIAPSRASLKPPGEGDGTPGGGGVAPVSSRLHGEKGDPGVDVYNTSQASIADSSLPPGLGSGPPFSQRQWHGDSLSSSSPDSYPTATSKDVLYTIRESHGSPARDGHLAPDEEASPYNTWGSRSWDVEDKLEEDLKSRSVSKSSLLYI
jgi:hypothetical protein